MLRFVNNIFKIIIFIATILNLCDIFLNTNYMKIVPRNLIASIIIIIYIFTSTMEQKANR